MKKRSLILLFIVVMVFLINTISAGVYFSQPSEIYNLGSIIKMNVDINPLEEGPLKISLNCDKNSGIVFYESMPSGKISFNLPLTSLHISNLTGDCYFIAKYKGKNYESRLFKISKKLKVNLLTDSFFSNPGGEIIIEGTAEKLNGDKVNGEIEITIPLLNLVERKKTENNENQTQNTENNKTEISENFTENISETESNKTKENNKSVEKNTDNGIFYGQVIDGQFLIKFNLAEDIPAGDYRIDIFVYEEYSGQKTSEGSAMANLKIFQVLKQTDIALSSQNLNPGENLSIKPILLDQSEVPIFDEVSVIIKNKKNEKIFQKIVQSGETIKYNLPTNISSGYYEIDISKESINSIKKFYVNEKEIADFKLKNNTLVVTNIGNVPYKKDVQIDLSGKPFIKKLNLDLNEKQEFKLTGSDKKYDVKISDGENEIFQSGVVLTGHIIGVDAVGNGKTILKNPIVWIFFIIILGAGILFLFRNIFKKKSFAYPFSKNLKKRNKNEITARQYKEDRQNDLRADLTKEKINASGVTAPNEAEKVLVLKGEKSRVAIIGLKIKNKLGKLEKQNLEKAVNSAYEKKGAVYEQGDFIFIIFSPLLTKTFKNEVIAAKIAEKIVLELKEHNRKFRDKIDFGIAINSGDIINKVENKKLKFTALGNLIIAVKRLAQSSDKQILATKEAYQGISEIKVEKRKINGGEVYEIKKIIDSGKNKNFIKGFLQRMEEEK